MIRAERQDITGPALASVDREGGPDDVHFRRAGEGSGTADASRAPALEGVSPAEIETATALLLKILARVLRAKNVAAEDNYLQLCHDLRRTIIVIREVKKATALELPLSLFMEAKDIRAIAMAMATRHWPQSTGLVLLKAAVPGTSLPPLFAFPGLGGALMELVDVVRAMDYAGSIYGLPYRGLDGYQAPADSVYPLVEDSLARMRAVQATGPYHMLAYSAGAYVAIEAARRLSNEGESLGFLGVIEPGVHERFWPMPVWIRFLAALVKMRHKQARQAEQKDAAAQPAANGVSTLPRLWRKIAGLPVFAMQKGKRLLVRIEHRYADPTRPGYVNNSLYYVGNLPELIQAVRDASIVCLASYRFRRYTGAVTYFRSEAGDPLMCRPEVVWPRYFPKLRFVVTPGDHASMIMPPNAAALAAIVCSHLPQAVEAGR
ncbi:MAG TPA: thioesterase domain-containing protein [Dongiaceae bacterium]|nr:thioesterase domain-containing protein [Dongiaceae bacterium]